MKTAELFPSEEDMRTRGDMRDFLEGKIEIPLKPCPFCECDLNEYLYDAPELRYMEVTEVEGSDEKGYEEGKEAGEDEEFGDAPELRYKEVTEVKKREFGKRFNDEISVICPYCGVKGATGSSERLAILNWNRRSAEAWHDPLDDEEDV